mmetsp:Transcript_21361/g.45136  ORF Transcript_21361/g.45136 Transcript_21361/m.45136 type:complete len:239 (+) Transcript_21361:330-1046(+)
MAGDGGDLSFVRGTAVGGVLKLGRRGSGRSGSRAFRTGLMLMLERDLLSQNGIVHGNMHRLVLAVLLLVQQRRRRLLRGPIAQIDRIDRSAVGQPDRRDHRLALRLRRGVRAGAVGAGSGALSRSRHGGSSAARGGGPDIGARGRGGHIVRDDRGVRPGHALENGLFVRGREPQLIVSGPPRKRLRVTGSVSLQLDLLGMHLLRRGQAHRTGGGPIDGQGNAAAQFVSVSPNRRPRGS